MIDLATPLLGPLAVPECCRAARRPWPIVARCLAGGIAALVALVAFWTWSIMAQADPTHLPFVEMRIGMLIVAGVAITVAMLQAPAFLAGSIAGEKERGSIGLLLATDASPLDIVLGRLAGGLGQVGLIVLATVPILLMLASVAGMVFAHQVVLIGLPLTVAVGAGGVAVGASAVSRKGRDALMLVYLLVALTQFAPLIRHLRVVSPFGPLSDLVWYEDPGDAAICAALWLTAGLAGIGLATWRLRPAALSEGASDRARKRAKRRWRRVPPVDDDRPMLWKEQFIERAGTLGGIGRWIGGAIAVALIGSSLILGGMILRDYGRTGIDPARTQWAVDALTEWVGDTAGPLMMLIWAAVGLRAAVAIASERERGTWDGLLTSPLDGREIVVGKLLGSLRAVQWLAVATVFAWVVAMIFQAITVRAGLESLGYLTIGAVFMAALGVRVSLHCATATRAMAATVAAALVCLAGLWIVTVMICLFGALVLWFGWVMLSQLGAIDATTTSPWFPVSFPTAYAIVFLTAFLALEAAIIIETALRFDRIAGRMTAGTAAKAVDRFLNGGPVRPVRVDLGGTQATVLVDREPMVVAKKGPQTPEV